jgi:hypothetical protein
MGAMPRGPRRERPLGRPVPSPLSEAHLNAVLLRLQDRFRWPETAERFVIAGQWQSRTASLYRCYGAPSGSPDVMLKVGGRWTPETARSLHEELDTMRGSFDIAGPISVAVPRALGWDGRPPLVCTGYVEGVDLYLLVSDLAHPGWDGSRSQPTLVLEACGKALGAYHARSTPDPTDTPSRERALRGLRDAARVCGVRRTTAERLADGFGIARAFGDIGPHQFRLADPGHLYLLDLPVVTTFEAVSRDIARFTFSLAKILGQDAGDRREQRRIGSELQDAFLRGYAETGPVDPTTPRERWLVRLFAAAAAAGTAHERLSQRAYGSALRHSVEWLGAVLDLRLNAPGR